MEACIEEAAVTQGLVGMALYDLLEVQLFALLREAGATVQLHTVHSSAVRTELHNLGTALRAESFRQGLFLGSLLRQQIQDLFADFLALLLSDSRHRDQGHDILGVLLVHLRLFL